MRALRKLASRLREQRRKLICFSWGAAHPEISAPQNCLCRDSLYLIAVWDLCVLVTILYSSCYEHYRTRFKEVIQKWNYIFITIFSLSFPVYND